MKENNGRAVARRRSKIRKVVGILFATFIIVTVFLLYNNNKQKKDRHGSSTTTVAVDDYDSGIQHQKLQRLHQQNGIRSKEKKIRNKDKKMMMKKKKNDHDTNDNANENDDDEFHQHNTNNDPRIPSSIREYVIKKDLRQILAANVHLIELSVDHTELQEYLQEQQGKTKKPSYNGIYGTFCTLDWSLHKNDPSSYPMFRDLVDHSSDCQNVNNRITNVNIYDITRMAQQYDAHYSTQKNNYNEMGATKALNITAVVFHESRCGSTLTANIFAGLAPQQHRVYSESSPPIQVLTSICGDTYNHCSQDVSASILQDVMYLMSRSNQPTIEERVFFKIQSVGTRYLSTFTKAFPTTPYLMVYREPVQVMMSHLKGNNIRYANCVRSYRTPPFSVQQTIQKYTPNQQSSLPYEEYCAAHLGSITETMIADHTEYGIPINYNVLTDTLYNDILPYLLHIPQLTSEQLGLVQNIASIYSKNRNGGGNKKKTTFSSNGSKNGAFQSDSEQKEQSASIVVRNAAQTYLLPSYQQLEVLSQQVLQRIRNQ